MVIAISQSHYVYITHYKFPSRYLQFQNQGPSIKYVDKIFRKTNISNPLIRTRTCAYQGVANVSFSGNFAYVLNG